MIAALASHHAVTLVNRHSHRRSSWPSRSLITTLVATLVGTLLGALAVTLVNRHHHFFHNSRLLPQFTRLSRKPHSPSCLLTPLVHALFLVHFLRFHVSTNPNNTLPSQPTTTTLILTQPYQPKQRTTIPASPNTLTRNSLSPSSILSSL